MCLCQCNLCTEGYCKEVMAPFESVRTFMKSMLCPSTNWYEKDPKSKNICSLPDPKCIEGSCQSCGSIPDCAFLQKSLTYTIEYLQSKGFTIEELKSKGFTDEELQSKEFTMKNYNLV